MFNLKFLLYFLLFGIAGCKPGSSSIPPVDEKTAYQYWHQGTAEITSYNLTTQLNNTAHEGRVSLICIAENLSKSKLLKLDESKKVKTDIIEVLRCNLHYEIRSGIDPINLVTSVYTPIQNNDNPHSLKVINSIQEWNGQTYTELLWRGHRYETTHHTYLESQPIPEKSLANTWLEDELLCRIRLSPQALPLGKIRMTPSAAYARLYNIQLKVYDAEGTLEKVSGEFKYTVNYADLKRKVEIHFKTEFPYPITKIIDWKDGKALSSMSRLKTIQSAYWKDLPGDTILRDSLYRN